MQRATRDMLCVIPDTAVAPVRMLHVYLFYLLRDLLVLFSVLAQLAGKPCIIGWTRYMKIGASKFYRVAIFFVTLFNSIVLPSLSYLLKVSLLSISFNFFNRWFSISAMRSWCFNWAISICACSSSVRNSCSYLRLPRRSSSPTSPSSLYFNVHVLRILNISQILCKLYCPVR